MAPHDERHDPGNDEPRAGGSEGRSEVKDHDRYGLVNLAIVFSTIAGTLADLGRDLSRLEGSSLLDRAVALDRVMANTQDAIGQTRKLLRETAHEAIVRGAMQG